MEKYNHLRKLDIKSGNCHAETFIITSDDLKTVTLAALNTCMDNKVNLQSFQAAAYSLRVYRHIEAQGIFY